METRKKINLVTALKLKEDECDLVIRYSTNQDFKHMPFFERLSKIWRFLWKKTVPVTFESRFKGQEAIQNVEVYIVSG